MGPYQNDPWGILETAQTAAHLHDCADGGFSALPGFACLLKDLLALNLEVLHCFQAVSTAWSPLQASK